MKDETYIVGVLDRSGSMSSIKKDVIGGYNEFIDGQKRAGANARFTLTQFDTEGIDVVHESKPIMDVPHLTEETYQPRGGTPLLDAIGKTINSTGAALSAIPEAVRPDKVVFIIITDGQENASRTFTKEQVKGMIELQKNTYRWQFVFLGANVDAFDEAHKLGIKMDNAANFRPTRMRAAYAVASQNLASYRGSSNVADLDFTEDQRKELDSE